MEDLITPQDLVVTLSRGGMRKHNHCLTIRRSVEVEEVDLRAPLKTKISSSD